VVQQTKNESKKLFSSMLRFLSTPQEKSQCNATKDCDRRQDYQSDLPGFETAGFRRRIDILLISFGQARTIHTLRPLLSTVRSPITHLLTTSVDAREADGALGLFTRVVLT
jgi:hypothetical protein